MKKKNRYHMQTKHLIAVMTILCIGLIALSLSSWFSFAPVRRALGYVIVPFQNGINVVGDWLTEQKNGFQSMKELAQENEDLKAQVDELEAKNSTLVQDQEEVDRLRTLYNLDQDYSEYDKVAAQVIGKDAGNWYNTFIINRGSECDRRGGTCRDCYGSGTSLGHRPFHHRRHQQCERHRNLHFPELYRHRRPGDDG